MKGLAFQTRPNPHENGSEIFYATLTHLDVTSGA